MFESPRASLVVLQRLFDGDAELVLLEPRRDVGMRLGVDVGIHPQRDPGLCMHLVRCAVNGDQFLARLHVEHENADLERIFDLVAPLAHAGVHDLLRIDACPQRAEQFAARNDVRPGPFLAEHPEHGAVGVGLERKADDVRNIRQMPGQRRDSGSQAYCCCTGRTACLPAGRSVLTGTPSQYSSPFLFENHA